MSMLRATITKPQSTMKLATTRKQPITLTRRMATTFALPITLRMRRRNTWKHTDPSRVALGFYEAKGRICEGASRGFCRRLSSFQKLQVRGLFVKCCSLEGKSTSVIVA
jgi:hypothetical protein